jgi:TonB family protein
MKKIFVFVLILISNTSFGQETIVIYLNAKWEITNKEKAVCKCQAEYDLDNFLLNGKTSCSNLDGSPRLLVNYKNGLKNGPAKLYSKNGQQIFSGTYEENLRSGLWTYNYPDGKLMQTIKFTDDSKSRDFDANIMVGEYYDPTGKQLVKAGNGIWNYDSIYASWADNVTLKTVRGPVKDSMKHGSWELKRLKQRKALHTEEFENGRFVTGQVLVESDGGFGKMPYEITPKFPDNYKKRFYNLETFKLDSTAFDESIGSLDTEKLIEAVTGFKYKIKTRSAGYLHGDFELMEFIEKNIKYPKEARQFGYQGTVIVQFTIDKNGKAKDFKVLKGAHESLNKEAVRVISSIKEWVSGLHNGVPYDKTIAIPVKFEL